MAAMASMIRRYSLRGTRRVKLSESLMGSGGTSLLIGKRRPVNKWPKRYRGIKTDFAVFAIDELAYGSL